MRTEIDIEPHSQSYLRWQLPLARFFAWLFMQLLGPFRSFGRYRVPKTGGLLILSNHLSDCDPIALQVACSRPIRFMAKSELFEMPVVSGVLKWHKSFPVKRGEADKTSIKRAVALLKAGECVCIFPEGQLSETGDLQELKAGVALIVRMSGASVLCAGLKNTNRIVPYGSYLPRPAFRWVEAHWGEPRSFEHHAGTEEILGWADGEIRTLIGQELY